MQIAKEQWDRVWDDLSEQLAQLTQWLEYVAGVENATEKDVAEIELLTADLFGANKRLKKRYKRQYDEEEKRKRREGIRKEFGYPKM